MTDFQLAHKLFLFFKNSNIYRTLLTAVTLHTFTSSAVAMPIPCIPQHKQHPITRALEERLESTFASVLYFLLSTPVPSYIIVAVETCHTDKYKGLGSYCRAVHVKPFLNEHTLIVILPCQPGRRQPCESFPTVRRRPVVQTACMIELS